MLTFRPFQTFSRCRSSRSLRSRACGALAAALLLAGNAWSQQGLRLTLQPSDLVIVPAPVPPALDLTVHWTPAFGTGTAIDMIAGRQVRTPGLGLYPGGMDGSEFQPPRPEPLSLRELSFVGVQFQGGARLTLRRRGDGLGLVYRASF